MADERKWDAILLSEVRAERGGVEWLGENDNLTAVIHGEKSAILLRGILLKLWCEEGQVKLQDKRSVSIKVRKTAHSYIPAS